jgi:nanoRNase/pAp phosphatase (c-di-AMP/oligoRNAs hydrolase)
VAVIDHHPLTPRGKYRDVFLDVREGTGATVTMLYEYLAAMDIPIPTWLASMMVYAIATETLDLSRNCTEPDLRAYLALLTRANMRVLGEIRHARLPRVYFLQIQDAMRNAYVYGRVAWSHLDKVEHPEIVPEVAELLLRLERITWSFCTAYQQDSLIVSLRSSKKGAHCGQILKRVVGKGGSAGGHEWMAGGYLDLTGLSLSDRESRRKEFVRDMLVKMEGRSSQKLEPSDVQARPLVEEMPAG